MEERMISGRAENGLKVSGLSSGYGKKKVLDEISFSIGEGEITGLLGENGCGKSTLLKALCGILPSTGKILYDNQDLNRLSVRKRAELTGYIPQKSGMAAAVSVLETVLMGFNPVLPLLSYPDARMKEKAGEALRRVGLSGLENENFGNLSEGQKQLVILARTFSAESRLLFLDEPESALDFGARYRFSEILHRYVSEKQASALVTLHDPVLALSFCSRLLLMKNGRIIGEIRTKSETDEEIGKKLRMIYGPLSVHTVRDSRGQEKKVLIREEI